MHIDQSHENQPGPQQGRTEPIRIVIFDDAKEAIDRFKKRFEQHPATIKGFRLPQLDPETRTTLLEFLPKLIVVDLMMGDSRRDGYTLIRELRTVPELSDVPIVVCSKFIGDSPPGQKEREKCLGLPGVVGAYSKIPDYPDLEVMLEDARNAG